MAQTPKSTAKNGNSGNDTSKADRRGESSDGSRDKRGNNAKTEPRDDEGRFARVRNFELPDMPAMPDVSGRSIAIGAVVLAAGVGLGAALFANWRKDAALPSEPWSRDQRDEDIFDDDDSIELSDARGADAEPFIDDDKRDAFAPALKPVPSRVEAMGNGDA